MKCQGCNSEQAKIVRVKNLTHCLCERCLREFLAVIELTSRMSIEEVKKLLNSVEGMAFLL